MTKTGDSPNFDLREAKAMTRQIIEHHFGTKPKRIVHQTSGLSNFVFMVYHAEGDFVVRLSPDPTRINSYIKEQWAVAKVKEVGVPTSEILEVGNQVVPHPYMISRKVNGHEATFHPERLSILREMGRYAALINSVPTDGFGSVFDWSNNQLSRNENWRDFLHGELQIESRLETLKKYRMISPQKIKTLGSILSKVRRPSIKPALTHGDIRLKNVMVDEEGEIVAIIDWEDCTSNIAPHWELSIALHDLSIDEKQKLIEGYRLPDKKMSEIAPFIKALNIINYAPHIQSAADSKDSAQMEYYRIRLNGTLDLYSL